MSAELLAAAAGLLFAGSYIPQWYKTLKLRATGEFSILRYTAVLAGLALWAVYGFIEGRVEIVWAYGVSLWMHGLLLSLILYYRKGPRVRAIDFARGQRRGAEHPQSSGTDVPLPPADPLLGVWRLYRGR